MNPRVTSVTPMANHSLLLQFNNGEQRRMDVLPYLAYPVFERLRESAFFALAQAEHGRVTWLAGVDLDPDSVYLESVPDAPRSSAGAQRDPAPGKPAG